MRQDNTKQWVLVSAAVVACPSFVCLYAGVGTLIGKATFTPDANTVAEQMINPLLGLPLLCLGLLPLLLPLGVWFFVNRQDKS